MILPFDVLSTIAELSLSTYRSILALSCFARISIQPRQQRRWLDHFITESTIHLNGHVIKTWRIDNGRTREVDMIFHRSNGPAKITWHYSPETRQYTIKRCEQWYYCGKHHRDEGPAYITYCANGNVKTETWIRNGRMIQNDGPNEVFYHDNGVVKAEKWFGSDGLHRPINLGPAVIEYDENGRKIAERWYQNGKLYNK